MHNTSPYPIVSEEQNLAAFPAGTRGWIKSVDEGPDANRLKALGLCVGHALEVARGGDPMVVDVFHTRVAIARALAEKIQLTAWPEVSHD